MPCIDDDFSSSLARSKDHIGPAFPPRVVPADFRKKNLSFKPKSRKQSRRNSLDRYEEADCCEKGDVLETVRSVGSLGSAPTLVDSRKDFEWRLSGASIMSGPPRRFSSPPVSPVTMINPCILREVEDDLVKALAGSSCKLCLFTSLIMFVVFFSLFVLVDIKFNRKNCR